jgi:subfamily B ATP-binding cassette protein MsbA
VVRQRTTLRRLFGYSLPYRSRLAWAVLGMVVYAVGSAGLAYLIKPIFDNLLPRQEQVAVIAWSVVGVYLLKGMGSYASSYLMADVGQRVVMDVRNELYRHILGQSAGFFAQGATGRLLSRVGNDVSQVQQAASETVGDLARETLALVGFASLMFWIDAGLALACLTIAPLIIYPLVRLGQRVRRTTRRSQEAQEQLSHLSTETFTGHRIVKAFGTEQQEGERFARAAYRLFRTNMKVTASMATLPPLMELLGGIGMALALWYGVRQISAGSLTPGQFVAFFTAVFMMYGPAKKLSRVNANLQQAIAAAERIFEMLDTHTEVLEPPDAAPLAPFQDTIEFRDVAFGYEDAPNRILRGVSFNVRACQMVVIVGRSGAGKTTLVNLLPRFYDVSAGAILIDGVDIRSTTLTSLRGQIGIVTQDTVPRRHRGQQHRVRHAVGAGGGGRSRRPSGERPRFHRGTPERFPDDDRRARAAVIGGAAAAAGHRAGSPQERADPGARRGHVRARRGVGAARAGGAGEPDAEPHLVRHRPPAVDDPAR